MRTRPIHAAAGLAAAALLLTGCTSSGHADAKPKPSPVVTVTATPTGDGISKACADAVYDLLLKAVDSGKTPDYRPKVCDSLTDDQWNQVIDEQGKKVFKAGKSALEGEAGDTRQQCVDAIAERPANSEGELPSEPTPAPCAGMSDDEYVSAYMDGLNQSNQAHRDELQKEIDKAAGEDADQ